MSNGVERRAQGSTGGDPPASAFLMVRYFLFLHVTPH